MTIAVAISLVAVIISTIMCVLTVVRDAKNTKIAEKREQERIAMEQKTNEVRFAKLEGKIDNLMDLIKNMQSSQTTMAIKLENLSDRVTRLEARFQ